MNERDKIAIEIHAARDKEERRRIRAALWRVYDEYITLGGSVERFLACLGGTTPGQMSDTMRAAAALVEIAGGAEVSVGRVEQQVASPVPTVVPTTPISLIPARVRFLVPMRVIRARVGIHKDVDAFRKAIITAGHKISSRADDLLEKIVFPPDMVEEEVEFWVVSNDQLGLTDFVNEKEVEKVALAINLVKCRPWDAPVVREVYRDQPFGERLLVMMDPLCPSNYPDIFCLEMVEAGSYLEVDGGFSLDCYDYGSRWLFRHE